MKVAVVTPTIATEHLQKCLESVRDQTYKDLTHYVFIDGGGHEDMVRKIITKSGNAFNTRCVTLDENIGKGWYGHRVYSACSFLVNADILCYLDEDNWYESNHVEELVNVIKDGNDWAYSLRKIYDKKGDYLCEDNCESLGKWPVYFNNQVFHIDTSSFAVKRDIATRIGHAWYGQWGADRQFFHNLKNNFPKYDCSRKHTLCYRLDGNPNSVTKAFFDQGNSTTNQKYNGKYPWKEERLSSPGEVVTLVIT